MEEINIELKETASSRLLFKQEMQATEKELRKKLDEVDLLSRALAADEREYVQRLLEFEEESRRVQQVNEALQE